MRQQAPFCVLCDKYTTYVVEEEGTALLLGRTVRLVPGDPVCLDHEARDKYGHPILIKEAPDAEPGKRFVTAETDRW